MKQVLLAIGLLVVMVKSADAQSATPLNSIVWDQPAVDLATAQAYTFRYYDDGAAVGVTFTGVVCAAKVPVVAGVFDCRAAFPAFTPGSHSVLITAANVAGESVKGVALTFQFVIVPSAPTNVRIQ